MLSAAFHKFPGDPMGSVFAYPVNFAPRDASGIPTGELACAMIDLRREDVLTNGVVGTNIIPNGSSYDLQVRFNASIPPYADEKQKARAWAVSNGQTPLDQGVALVHKNFIYSDFTYGAIAVATASGDWVTIVTGTTFSEATAIALALQQ